MWIRRVDFFLFANSLGFVGPDLVGSLIVKCNICKKACCENIFFKCILWKAMPVMGIEKTHCVTFLFSTKKSYNNNKKPIKGETFAFFSFISIAPWLLPKKRATATTKSIVWREEIPFFPG